MLPKSPVPTVLLLACLSAGCQHLELKNHTVRQATTLSDIQYRQVLGNLAMFSENPNALPYLAVTGTGTTNITDSLNAGGGFTWDKALSAGKFLGFVFDHGNAMLGGTSTSSEQWTSGSILNPDQLLYMRCIYQLTVGAPGCDCDCTTRVRAYFTREPCYLEAMRPGWFCVGRLRDVPKGAAHVGRYKDTFAWVMPEGVDSLTKLTLAVLDVGTNIKIGEVGRIDPFGAALAALYARANNLKGLLKDLPATDPNYKPLTADLDVILKSIAFLESPEGKQHTVEEITTGKRTRVVPVQKTVIGPDGRPMTVTAQERITEESAVLRGFKPEERQMLADLLRTAARRPVTAPERATFYNPLQPNLVPTVVP